MTTRVVARMEQRTKRLVGTDEHLANVLRSYHARGDLVTPVNAIRPRRIASDMSEVTVILRERVAVPTLARRALHASARWAVDHRRGLRRTAIGLAVAGAVLGVVGTIVYTILWLANAAIEGAASSLAGVSLGSLAGGLLVLAAIAWSVRRLLGGGDGHKSGYGFHYGKCK
jgi:hypothetical protein